VACSQGACAFQPGGGAAPAGSADGGSGTPDSAAAAIPSPDGASAARCPEDPDLLACLSFDGDAIDDSSHHIPVALGEAPSYAAGVVGQALDAGEGVDVTLAESVILDPPAPLLIDLWVRADTLPEADARAGLVDNEGQWGFFVYAGGRVSCTMAGAVSADAVLAVGSWTHLACAYDGAAIRLFEDGALVGEAAAGSSLSAGGTDGTAIARNSPSGQYFDGLIDELRIWRRGAP
jgi:hypothetical protein